MLGYIPLQCHECGCKSYVGVQDGYDQGWQGFSMNVQQPEGYYAHLGFCPNCQQQQHKSLFDSFSHFTEDASEVEDAVCKVLQPIFQQYIKRGYSPREISHIIMLASMTLECEELLVKCA